MSAHQGRPPSDDERALALAAATLAPDKSLQRLDEFAKYLLSLSALASTTLTGFGLATGASCLSSGWMLIPVILFAISFSVSISGIIPRLTSINTGDLEQVLAHFDRVLTKRGTYIWWAGVSFAAGLVAAPAALVAARTNLGDRSTVSVRFKASVTSGLRTAINGTASYATVPDGACVTTSVRGESDGRSSDLPLFKDTSQADASGKLTVSFSLSDLDPALSRVVVEGTPTTCLWPFTTTLK